MKTEFFLGANSANGFYSLYDEYCREKGGFFHLIKGGPGGGKSSFMRRIGEMAESAGYDVEYIRCSGDPMSLDGVYITQLYIGYVDATSPHALEPFAFGVSSDYVNLGQFCAVCESEEITQYTELYKKMYATAYSYLKAADCVKSAETRSMRSEFAVNKAKMRASNAVKRELGNQSCSGGNISRRFISCFSFDGKLVLSETIDKLCKHIILLDDRFGLEQIYLYEVISAAEGERLVVCPSPLNPSQLEAVLIPEKGLGFVSSSLLPHCEAYRHIRLDALIPADTVRSHRAEIRSREKLFRELTDTACGYLKRAKEYHDLLERAYSPYINFPALSEFTEQEIESLKFESLSAASSDRTAPR